MDKTERFRKAVKYLKDSGQSKNMKDMASAIGCTPQSLSSAHNGDEKYLNDTFLQKFNDTFGKKFNLEWLINGVGNMLCCEGPGDINAMFNAQGDNSTNTQIVNGDIDLKVELAEYKARAEELTKQVEEQHKLINLLIEKLSKI